MRIQLNHHELTVLMQPQSGRGGFQSLMRSLQAQALMRGGILILTPHTIERIVRYAFQYNNGGWQLQLRKIFGRTLQPFQAVA
ncbi:MAG: aspartyl-tRNA synthetase [Spirochaetales bacterium]|nr:aspartyl-tRNA synthetase [Spirochaetales bacterium]